MKILVKDRAICQSVVNIEKEKEEDAEHVMHVFYKNKSGYFNDNQQLMSWLS